MKSIIIGLGNPGEDHKNDRHNVGHLFIDWLSSKETPIDAKFLKTEVFMNDSGSFVRQKVDFFKIKPDCLYVVHDELDIPFGEFKIQFGVGPKVHNGIISVEQALGTQDFWRVRIGTDARIRGEGKLGDSGKGYVLDSFSAEELKILEEVFAKVWKELETKLLNL